MIAPSRPSSKHSKKFRTACPIRSSPKRSASIASTSIRPSDADRVCNIAAFAGGGFSSASKQDASNSSNSIASRPVAVRVSGTKRKILRATRPACGKFNAT